MRSNVVGRIRLTYHYFIWSRYSKVFPIRTFNSYQLDTWILNRELIDEIYNNETD